MSSPGDWLHPETTAKLLDLLRSPAGALAFVPLYALWVTLLLPGVWASMLAGALYGTCRGAQEVKQLGCRLRMQPVARGRHQ